MTTPVTQNELIKKVRDIDTDTLKNLTSAQEAQILEDGTYNDESVADGTVFTTEEGKFKEFEIGATYNTGVFSTVTSSYSSKTSCGGYEEKDIAVMIEEGGSHIITDDGTTQTSINVSFSPIYSYYCNGNYFVWDNAASKMYVSTDLNNWTELTSISISMSIGIFSVVFQKGYYFIAFQNSSRNVVVIKLSEDFSSATTVESLYEYSASWPQITSDGNNLALFLGGVSSSTFYMSNDDGVSWQIASLDSTRQIRGWAKIDDYIYLLDIYNSKVVRTADFLSFESFNIANYSGVSPGFHLLKVFGKSLALVGYASCTILYCPDLSTMTFTEVGSIASTQATVLDSNVKGFVAGGYTVNDYYRIPVEETSTYSLVDLTPTVTVDQTYNSSSANAQSGVAIAGAGFLTKGMSAIAIGTSASAVYQSIAVGEGANATGSSAIALGNNEITATRQCIAIGNYIETGSQYNAIAIGNGANGYSKTKATGDSSIAIGSTSQAVAWNAIAVGPITYASSTSAIAIGYLAKAQANYAIQLGYGTNSTANTFSVGLSDSNNYQLLDSSGHIPGPRMSLQGAAAPDTSTVGSVGQFYVDTTNQDAYICVSDASSTYTWKKITP